MIVFKQPIIAAFILTMLSVFGMSANANSVIQSGNCAVITSASKDLNQVLRTIKTYRSFSVPFVIKSSSGFFATAVGVYPDFMGKDAVANLVNNGLIPSDSYCGNSDRFIEILLPDPDFTRLDPSLLSRYSYVGEWNTDLAACGSQMMTDHLIVSSYSISRPFSYCDVRSQFIPPMGHGAYLGVQLLCRHEGETYESSMTLFEQAVDELTDLEDPDGKIYYKCN